MNDFEQQLLRLKQALGVSQDQAVAEALGMSKAAFSERKRTGSFPERHVFELAAKRLELRLDPIYVMTGRRSGAGASPVDGARFAEVVVAIDAAIARANAHIEPARKAGLYLGLYETAAETGVVSERAAELWVKLASGAAPPTGAPGAPTMQTTFHGTVGSVHAVHQGTMHNEYHPPPPAPVKRKPK